MDSLQSLTYTTCTPLANSLLTLLTQRLGLSAEQLIDTALITLCAAHGLLTPKAQETPQ